MRFYRNRGRNFFNKNLLHVMAFLFVLILMSGLPLFACDECKDKVFVLDSMTGRWIQLSSGNSFATASSQGGASGACDKKDWVNNFTNHARVAQFDKGIVKTATPITKNIRVLPDNSFEVPLFQEAAWRIKIVVSNSNLEEMNEVEVDDNFPAEFRIDQIKVSQGKVYVNTTGNAEKVHMRWIIGDLVPGKNAELELVASTKNNPAGKQEFTSPGLHELNPGAILSSKINGKTFQYKTGPIYIQAIKNDVWQSRSGLSTGLQLRSMEVQPLMVNGLDVGDANNRTVSSLKCTEKFDAVSPEISFLAAHKGFPDGFQVPEGMRAEWRFTLVLENPTSSAVSNIVACETLGKELDIIPDSPKWTPAGSELTFNRQNSGVGLMWKIDRLEPGQRAELTMNVSTRSEDGEQLYSKPTGPWDPEYLNCGANIRYNSRNCLQLVAVPVWVKEGSYIRISLNSTRYDWQIRKPGVFTAEPIVININSNHKAVMTFSKFSDLINDKENAVIPAYYGFGDSLSDVDRIGWLRANSLNSFKITYSEKGSLNVWKLWPKIIVSEKTRAGEYEDIGYLTFTVSECNRFVDGAKK